jgi:hypothetical protein
MSLGQEVGDNIDEPVGKNALADIPSTEDDVPTVVRARGSIYFSIC